MTHRTGAWVDGLPGPRRAVPGWYGALSFGAVAATALLGLVVLASDARAESPASVPTPSASAAEDRRDAPPASEAKTKPLPRLVDLGAGKCIPCKLMAPILDDLRKSLAGKLDVVFIDVWEKPDDARAYGIRVIPTQIFYDSAGKELFRHEGFFGKQDILAKWKELGVVLDQE